jgi:hypothetical protein
MVCHPVELLRSHDQLDATAILGQFATPALRHATEVSEDLLVTMLAGMPNHRLHLPNSLLFSKIPNAARVQQDDIRRLLIAYQSVTPPNQLRGDSLAVAFVHLASVRLDVNCRHSLKGQKT